MPIYLDHAAGAPLRPAAAEAFLRASALAGNASSVHGHGQAARRLLEESRERLAVALGCDPREVVLTSGGTESVNLAVKGAFWAAAGRRSTVLLPRGEHRATADAVRWLEVHQGARAAFVEVDGRARLDPAALGAALKRHAGDAALVTFLWASNEVGTINPVAQLTGLAAAAGVPSHVDAIAAFGSVPVRFDASGADLLSVSAHKIGGPAGVGALVVGRRCRIEPLQHGGGQERELRSGTVPVAAAHAFAVAAEEAVQDLGAESARLAGLRDRALRGLLAALPGAVLRGAPTGERGARLPGNLHVTVAGADGEALLLLLDVRGISVSTGSACQAGVTRPSAVLLAMGVPAEEARGALRITLGRTSTDADVDALLAALPALAAVAA